MRSALVFPFLAALSVASCSHTMKPDKAILALHASDAKVRQKAADSLRLGNVVPSEAIDPLLQAYPTEPVAFVKGAILVTLGTSGAPQAKPLIDQAVLSSADVDSRRWAGHALKAWMIQTGALPESTTLPPGWPYGQPGFPPPL